MKYLLCIDTVSFNPSIYFCSPDNKLSQVIQLKEEFNSSSDNRYNTDSFFDKIIELLQKFRVKLSDIDCIGFCDGPGAFSPLRVACIITRLFKSFKPEVKIYKFSQLYLIYKFLLKNSEIKLNSEIKQVNLFLPVGQKGFFKQEYYINNNKIISEISLCESIQELSAEEKIYTQQLVISQDEYKKIKNLSEIIVMLVLELKAENKNNILNNFLVKTESEIFPNYCRDAGVTIKKNNNK